MKTLKERADKFIGESINDHIKEKIMDEIGLVEYDIAVNGYNLDNYAALTRLKMFLEQFVIAQHYQKNTYF
jgi:hypothetical protein